MTGEREPDAERASADAEPGAAQGEREAEARAVEGAAHEPGAERDEGLSAARAKLEAARAAYEAARESHRSEREGERERGRESRRSEREAERARRHQERQERRRERGAFGFDPGPGFHIDLGALAAGFADVGGEEFIEEVERVFTVEGMPRLHSRNISGETHIAAGEAGTVRIRARKRVRGSSAEKAKRLLQNVEIRIEQSGDLIEVKPHLYEQDRGWLELFRGGRVTVDLEIAVPRESAIEAHTVSGDLSLEGTRGPAEIQSVSGDVRIADHQGPLWLKTVSGDASCVEYAGSCETNTVSGDVSYERCRLRDVDLVTVSGDVSLDAELEPGKEHRLKSISGDIELGLAGPSYEIGYKTMSGDLQLHTEARVAREGRRDRTVLIGDGGTRVLVKTVSGDLTVRTTASEMPRPAAAQARAGESERAVPVAPVVAEEPRRDEARAVLERLARGELDVEAAAAALDASRFRGER